MISSLNFWTNTSHPYSCLTTATWANDKEFTGTIPGNFDQVPGNIAKVVGNKIYLHGSQPPKGTIPRNLSWNPYFLHGINSSFRETASSWDLCPPRQGPREGMETARGTFGQPENDLIGPQEHLSCLFGKADSFVWTSAIPNPNHLTTNMLMQNTTMIMPIRQWHSNLHARQHATCHNMAIGTLTWKVPQSIQQ